MTETLIVGFRRNAPEAGPPFEGSATARTLDKIMPSWRDFAGINLYQDLTDESDPKPRFEEAMSMAKPKLVVMLGRQVEKTLTGKANHTMLETFEFDDVTAIVVPHPSTRNRVWNDKTMIDKTRVAIDKAMKTVVKEAS